MDQKNGTVIKLTAPETLKQTLKRLAAERHVSLAALVRLILAEYVKKKGGGWL